MPFVNHSIILLFFIINSPSRLRLISRQTEEPIQDYLDAYVELLTPMGKLGLTDDPEHLNVMKLKSKSLSLHWEFMFARSMFATPDMQQQHKILSQIAQLIDDKKLRTTVGQHLGKISADNLREAHRILESGRSVGKLVLEGF